MQTYKISTLGESFVFINRSMLGGEEELPKIYTPDSDNCHVVEIMPDLRCDYRIHRVRGNAFAPDLARAVLVFLHAVKGLPRSEYEIIFDNDRIIQMHFADGFGGNVGKCKLLFSKHLQNDEKCDILFYCVEAPQGNYIFVICDKTDVVDMRKLASRTVLECASASNLAGLCALSYNSGEATFKFHSLDNSASAETSSYAAAAYLLGELVGECSFVIKNGDFKTLCRVDDCGVRVYDLFPAVHKIF